MTEWPPALPPFLWGVAASAHQVEGHQPGNDWIDWEAAGHTREPSGIACDHWRRYSEDFQLFRAVNANAYRTSLEWSRLEPEPGRFDSGAFAHYRAMMAAAREAGLEPLVTVLHFTLPRWFAAEGGWLGPNAITHFARYCQRVVEELPDVRLWCTINEPTVLAVMGYVDGVWPPGHRRLPEARTVLARQLAAHRTVYPMFKSARTDAWVGLAHHVIHFRPWRPQPADRALVRVLDRVFNRQPIRRLLDVQDYIGVNYYACRYADWRRPFNPRIRRPSAAVTDMGWEEDPDGLAVLLAAFGRWGKPLLVTENGIATDDEARRARYIDAHVAALAEAGAAGADVRGYFYWSGLDNFEWAEGYRPRFGLYAVERDLTRRRKAGAEAFAAWAARGGRPFSASPAPGPPAAHGQSRRDIGPE